MTIVQSPLTEAVEATLIRLSENWEQENSCFGYRKNTHENLAGEAIFLATEQEQILGYLLCHLYTQEDPGPTIPRGSRCLEIGELYVLPTHRSQGIGRELYQYAAEQYAGQAEFITLATATKDYRSILHFYLDELGMTFWSARLFQKL